MLRFVLRKMINKRWMVLSLLIGNILLISITSSTAMYGHAALQRTLTQKLYGILTEENRYPGQVTVQAGSSSARNYVVADAAQLAQEMPEAFDLPLIERVDHYYVAASTVREELEREDGLPSALSLGCMSDLKDHIEIVAGRMYAEDVAEDGTVEVIVSEQGIMEMNLILGERMEFTKYTNELGEPLFVRVVGVFRNSQPDDPYWVRTPSSFRTECLMPEAIFSRLFIEDNDKWPLNAQFYVLMDYEAMRGDQAARLYEQALQYDEMISDMNGVSYRDNFSSTLADFLVTARKVNVTLWVLEVPIFVLLAAFIFMVSRQMLDMEQSEIAVLKSRGASRAQIIVIYLIQSVVLALIALAVGLPLGAYLVQVLGSANAFMEFVRRTALQVEVNREVMLYALAAALFSVCAMVLPVFRHANVTIVHHKQKKHRKSDAPLWQKLYLDVVVLAVSLYGLYTYNTQADILAQRVMDGASLDPLLFISSSLFMIGAGLFALRILPLFTALIFRLFRRWWSPALYAAFLRVIRTRHSQSFIMVFLILTIALGIFNAQAARTINSNEEDNIAYSVGADLVIREPWQSNSDQIEAGSATELVYQEPDYGVYRDMEGVKSSTRVLTDRNVSMSVPGGTLKNITLMGIHTKTFGETAWMKSGLLPHHFYEYLNAMSLNARAVLLSRNYQLNYGYKLGDVINYRNSQGDTVRGVVYGFVDYWPTYVRYVYARGTDGVYKQQERYLIVANLAQLQASWGITPYDIWIDAEDSTSFLYRYAEENDVSFAVFQDTSASMVAKKNDPVFQGTNGILTVGFIVVLLLCAVGFLIYWILSIQSRTLQFGIYRAMGMSMREIVSMLLGEQLFISATSIGMGIAVGILTSKLYMPLIQMAYAAYDSALPLRVVSDTYDMVRLLVVVGIMMFVCMAILGWLISRMKIAQALKLGED